MVSKQPLNAAAQSHHSMWKQDDIMDETVLHNV